MRYRKGVRPRWTARAYRTHSPSAFGAMIVYGLPGMGFMKGISLYAWGAALGGGARRLPPRFQWRIKGLWARGTLRLIVFIGPKGEKPTQEVKERRRIALHTTSSDGCRASANLLIPGDRGAPIRDWGTASCSKELFFISFLLGWGGQRLGQQ